MTLPSKANVSRPLAEGYGALIEYGDNDTESLYLRLAVGPDRQMILETVPPVERGPDTGENPEDMRSESGATFSRSTFSGGEGLDYAHRRNGTDRDWARFWDSRNVDVTPARAGRLSELKLLHSTSSLRAADPATVRTPLVTVGGVLYGILSDVDLVDRTVDPTAAVPVWTTEDPGASSILEDLAALGDEVYAAAGNQIFKRASGGGWSLWSVTTDVDRLWSAKERIIGSGGRALYEARAAADEVTGVTGENVDDLFDVVAHGLDADQPIQFTALTGGSNLNVGVTYYVIVDSTDTFAIASSPGGAAVNFGSDVTDGSYRASLNILLHTLASGEIWHDVVDAGSAILAAASDGLVYAFVEEDGELTLTRQTPIAEGEIPTALGFSQGLVFVGTAERTSVGGKIGRLWRVAFVGVRLAEAQVIRQWGDGSTSVDRSPKRIIDTRDSVWTAVIEDGTETHLWRYHLETGGISRDLIFGDAALVHGLVSIDERMFASLLGSALYREDTVYADEGWLIGPLADFFNAAPKAWVGARLEIGDLPTDTSVVLAYSTSPAAIEDDGHASWVDIITFDDPTEPSTDESPITEVESRFITGKVTLTPNPANTATPTVLGFAFRGLADVAEDEYSVPINISDRLEVPGRKALTVNGAGDAIWNQLQTLKGQAVTFTLLRPSEIIDGQFRSVSVPVKSTTPLRGSATTYALMVVRGLHR